MLCRASINSLELGVAFTLLKHAHGFACWAMESSIPVLKASFPHRQPVRYAAWALIRIVETVHQDTCLSIEPALPNLKVRILRPTLV